MSSVSSANRAVSSDVEMGKEELQIECYNLKSQNAALVKQLDDYKQQLYETKRQLETAKVMEGHLLTEIEALQVDKSKYQSLSQKLLTYEEEIVSLKQENQTITQNYESQLVTKDSDMKRLNELFNSKQKSCENTNQSVVVQCQDEIQCLKAEIETLLISNNQHELNWSDVTKQNALLENKIAELNDDLTELRRCLAARTEELSESNEVVQDLRDEHVLMQLEIDRLKNAPSEKAEKGNSIFAEIEDSRQELQKHIRSMNRRYTDLKMKYNSKTEELKQLHLEYASLSKLLASQNNDNELNAELIESYKRHIAKLTENINHLENEIHVRRNAYTKLMQGDIKSAETLIEITRKEVLTLRRNLLAESLALNLSEELLHETKTELGKWQAETMQLRVQVMRLNQIIEKAELAKECIEDVVPVEEVIPSQRFRTNVSFENETVAKITSPADEISTTFSSKFTATDFKKILLFQPDDTIDIKSPEMSEKVFRAGASDLADKHILSESNNLFDKTPVEKIHEEIMDVNKEGKENAESEVAGPTTKTTKNKRVAFSDSTAEPKATHRPRRGGRIIVVPCVHIPSLQKK